jgi:hypothetical protein
MQPQKYARKRQPNEAAPRTYVPPEWTPKHPDLVVQIVRPGANNHQQIKSRGIG